MLQPRGIRILASAGSFRPRELRLPLPLKLHAAPRSPQSLPSLLPAPICSAPPHRDRLDLPRPDLLCLSSFFFVFLLASHCPAPLLSPPPRPDRSDVFRPAPICSAFLLLFEWFGLCSTGDQRVAVGGDQENMRYFNVMILGPAQSPYEVPGISASPSEEIRRTCATLTS